MRGTVVVGLLVAAFVAARCATFLHRIQSADLVALAFAEGGDDAYYVFTVARNIGSGFGITIDRVNWTSGFQPLWTLLCSLPYLVAGDRGAFAVIYAASVALWLGSAFILLRIVQGATGRELPPAAAAVIVGLFLCETQLNEHYVSGLETGLYLTLCLALLLAFQRRLDRPTAGWKGAVGLGVLCGVAMLVRNDAVFVCATLIGVTLLAGDWKCALRESFVIVSVAAVLVLPWLAYCYWLSGDPMPQSGIATAIAVRGESPRAADVLYLLVASVVPTLVVKVRTVIAAYWPVVGLSALAFAGVAAMLRSSWMPTTSRGFRLALAGFAAAMVPLVAYYCLASWASHFFERYFTPLKLIVVVLMSLAIARAFDRRKPLIAGQVAVVALAVVAACSNLYWVWRGFYLPYRGFMGEEAYAIVRSPYSREGLRLGIAESGRLGFLYPDRVVNLDGKMRVDVLRALRDGKIGEFIHSNDFDYLFLRQHDLDFFDRLSPDWRQGYQLAGTLGLFDVFARSGARVSPVR